MAPSGPKGAPRGPKWPQDWRCRNPKTQPFVFQLVLYQFGYMFGMQKTAASDASLIIGFNPVSVSLLSVFILSHNITRNGMFGFFLSENLPRNFEDVLETDDEMFKKFFNAALNQGIYFAPSRFEAGFISSTHDQDIIDQTKYKIEKAIKEL